jgi:predicted transcriptional regulator
VDRLTISLDDDSEAIIDTISKKYNLNKTGVIRKALQILDQQEKLKKTSSTDTIQAYCEFLENKDHIILDVDHWDTFFREIDEGSEEFWNEVYEIGVEHQKEYHNKGMRTVRDILSFVEKTNWYILNEDSEKSFTLILNLSNSGKFVEYFFKGFFKNHPQQVKIEKGARKIRVTIE